MSILVAACSSPTPEEIVPTIAPVSDGQAQAALLRAYEDAKAKFDADGTFKGLSLAQEPSSTGGAQPEVSVSLATRYEVVLIADSSQRAFCLGQRVEHRHILPGIALGTDPPTDISSVDDCWTDNRSDAPPPWLPWSFIHGKVYGDDRYWSGWGVWDPMPRCEVPSGELTLLGRVRAQGGGRLTPDGVGQEVFQAEGPFDPDSDPLWVKVSDGCYVSYWFEPRG